MMGSRMAPGVDRDKSKLLLHRDWGGFLTISQILERILMEHIDMKNSLDSKLQIYSICSIRIRSRKLDIIKMYSF